MHSEKDVILAVIIYNSNNIQSKNNLFNKYIKILIMIYSQIRSLVLIHYKNHNSNRRKY